MIRARISTLRSSSLTSASGGSESPLCKPAEASAPQQTFRLEPLQISCLQNTHQGNTHLPARPQTDASGQATLGSRRPGHKEGQHCQPNPAHTLPSRLQSQPGSSSLQSPMFTPCRCHEINNQSKGHNTVQASGRPYAHFQARSWHIGPVQHDHQRPCMQGVQARLSALLPRRPTNAARSHLCKWHHQLEPGFTPTVSSKYLRCPLPDAKKFTLCLMIMNLVNGLQLTPHSAPVHAPGQTLEPQAWWPAQPALLRWATDILTQVFLLAFDIMESALRTWKINGRHAVPLASYVQSRGHGTRSSFGLPLWRIVT